MEEFRVKFNSGEQRKFIELVKKKLNYTFDELSKKTGETTIRSLKNYTREYCLMPLSLLTTLCYLSGIDIKSLNVTYVPSNWGQIKGGKKAIKIVTSRYKKKIVLWRKKGNFNSTISHLKNIKFPELDEQLSEFIGAYLGDGTITSNLVRITGDSRYDYHYLEYLSNLVENLFGIKSNIVKDKYSENTINLFIRSKKICSFLNKEYKIKYGDKIRNKTGIPNQILINKELSLACLRGLIDTDGCISRRGRRGSQFCVQFFSKNERLLKQVNFIGKKYGFFSYFSENEVGTNKWINILKYFEEVGSSNLKHIVRFSVKRSEERVIYLREVLDYYEKPFYKDISLPFKV